MEWKIFEPLIDETLYVQMKELIYLSCTMEDKYRRKQTQEAFELFKKTANTSLKETYGLSYPGEVLERLGEHREITPKEIRTLGLALARTKELQENSMFVENQLSVFLKRLYALPMEKDPFLLCIRYVLDDKKKASYYHMLLQYTYTSVAEILAVLSFFPQDDTIWDKVKGRLNELLGKKCQISVPESPAVYVYLSQHFYFRMKGYRKKNLEVLKYLMRLPFSSVLGSGKLTEQKLKENGYSSMEVLFLNGILIHEVKHPETVAAYSITAEKLAIEFCRQVLDAKQEYPEPFYEFCSTLCRIYKSFTPKVQGYEDLPAALGPLVKIKNVKSFFVLYPYMNDTDRRHWMQINLTDSKWDVLYGKLPTEKYDLCVTETLETEQNASKLKDSILHYRELTGNDYTNRFWEEYSWKNRSIFEHLVNKEVLPAANLMDAFLTEYLEDEKKAVDKWKNMVWYLHAYCKKVKHLTAYQVMERYAERIGVADLPHIFSAKEIWESCFKEKGSYARRNEYDMDMVREFLTPEQHQKLFSWIDAYIFQYHTGQYQRFLLHVLSQEKNLLWFPKEDATDIFQYLGDVIGEFELPTQLRKIYLSEQEQEELKRRELLKKEEQENRKLRHELREMRYAFSVIVAKTRKKAGQFQELNRFLNTYSYKPVYRRELTRCMTSYLRDYFAREPVYLYGPQDLEELLSLLTFLYCEKRMQLKEIKDIFCRVEERTYEENQGTDHGAPGDGK